MIKAVIFDWGGVLEPCNNRFTAKKLSTKYNIDEEKLFKRLDSLEDEYSKGENCAEFYEIISKEFNIPKTVLHKSLNQDHDYLAFNVAKTLKSKGYKVFILSNQMNSKTAAIRNHNDLSFFDHCFFSNEIKMMKPDKDIFEYFIGKTHLNPNECIFIDDHERYLIPARELGFNTILFKNLEQLKKDLSSFGIKSFGKK
ncbi:HAD family phosphatase [Candidatus Woesearchaeota archaeon]|nr:HAD family phosphatase [Candidatus Woesearchaeota archaeon]